MKKEKTWVLGFEPMTIKPKKGWDDSPETFCEAEAANRFTFRLEISALEISALFHAIPIIGPNFALTKKPVREKLSGPPGCLSGNYRKYNVKLG